MLSKVGADSLSRSAEICDGDNDTDYVEEPEPVSSSELTSQPVVIEFLGRIATSASFVVAEHVCPGESVSTTSIEPETHTPIFALPQLLAPPPQVAHDVTPPVDDSIERESLGEYRQYTWSSDDDEDDTSDGVCEVVYLHDPEPTPLPLSVMPPPPPKRVATIARDDYSSDDAEDMCDGLSLQDIFMEPETYPPPLSFSRLIRSALGI